MGEGSDHTEMSLQALEQLRVGQIPAEEPTCGETSVEHSSTLCGWKVRVELTVLEVLMLSFKYWLVKSHTFTVPSDTVCSSAPAPEMTPLWTLWKVLTTLGCSTTKQSQMRTCPLLSFWDFILKLYYFTFEFI